MARARGLPIVSRASTGHWSLQHTRRRIDSGGFDQGSTPVVGSWERYRTLTHDQADGRPARAILPSLSK